MKKIDLSGKWLIKDTDKSFTLPGGACENKLGAPQEEYPEMTREAVRCLRPAYNYVGRLTLTKTVDIPQDFEGKQITLFIERVNMLSELYIDSTPVERPITELSVPHIYHLPPSAKPGKHVFTLTLDNSNILNIDGMASGYSEDTQSIWIGAAGRIELRCEERTRMSNIQVFPHEKSISLRITANSLCRKPKDKIQAKIRLSLMTPGGKMLPEKEYTSTLFNRKQIVHLEYAIDEDIEYWSEFNPVLYTLCAVMECDGVTDKQQIRFGMREISVIDKQLCLNNKPLFLRGTLDCGIYPLTGYPPTDKKTWDKTMNTVKEYGLNHIRFHAWCPPEAAFEAADEAGVYLSVEMPLWLNHDVCGLETGDDPIHRSYYMQEALNISNTYGNHPSFIMFSNGNELMGDFEMLEEITAMIRSYDNRRLYTLTSNFDHAIAPCEDYLCAFEASGKRVRIQVFHDIVSEHTCLSYDEAVKDTPVPVISFEVGQYCVYPNVDSAKDYTGNLLPVNFNVIKRDMEKKGLYKKLHRYIKASGMIAALLYKEDIEAAERTHKMGGFELLGLTDYTGQCTATVGLLDVFWNSKGLISPEEFRSFCSPVVPLMKAKRIFLNSEKLRADFDLYDFGETPKNDIVYTLRLERNGEILKEASTSERHMEIDLDFIDTPSMIRASLSACGHTNSWNIFVYPEKQQKYNVTVLNGTEGLDNYIENGGNVIVHADMDNLKKPVQGLFKPVFWSPAYFVSDRACGLWCDNTHPIFEAFPTEDYADFQWKHPIDNSVSTDISELPEDFEVLLEPVPNFFSNVPRSPLFEAKIGKANVLFCGFNLNVDNKAINALKYSIEKYVSSDKFIPKQELDANIFKGLFK